MTVDATADGSEPVVVQAVAEDLSTAETPSDALSIPVAANQAPAATLALAAGATERVKPGGSTEVTVQASDTDGLATVELRVGGPATEPVRTRSVTGTDAAETFTVTAAPDATLTALSVTAVVTDQLGASFTTAALEIPIVADPDPPVVTLTLDPDLAQYTAGDVVQVTASATDDTAVESLSLTIDGATETSGGSPDHHHLDDPAGLRGDRLRDHGRSGRPDRQRGHREPRRDGRRPRRRRAAGDRLHLPDPRRRFADRLPGQPRRPRRRRPGHRLGRPLPGRRHRALRPPGAGQRLAHQLRPVGSLRPAGHSRRR